MGDFFKGLAALTCLISFTGCSNVTKEKQRVTVLCYNIHHGAGMDRKLDLKRIGEIIKRVNPDIVALQEVEDKTSRTGKVDQPKFLGEMAGLKHAFGKAISFAGGGYGNAILSRFPIKDLKNSPLPGNEARVLMEATLELADGQDLVFMTTHLDTNSPQQIKSLPIIAARVKANAGKLMLMAGDFNSRPESPTIQTLQKDWTNATSGPEFLTCPSNPPTEQIDYIFYRPVNKWRVVSRKTLDEPVASDHLPIVIVFELVD